MYALTISVYATCILASVGCWLWARRHPDTMTPLGTLLETVFTSPPARIAALMFWWWLGWHFLVAPVIGG